MVGTENNITQLLTTTTWQKAILISIGSAGQLRPAAAAAVARKAKREQKYAVGLYFYFLFCFVKLILLESLFFGCFICRPVVDSYSGIPTKNKKKETESRTQFFMFLFSIANTTGFVHVSHSPTLCHFAFCNFYFELHLFVCSPSHSCAHTHKKTTKILFSPTQF